MRMHPTGFVCVCVCVCVCTTCRWRCLTGENWNVIMYDVAVSTDCNDNPTWDEPEPTGCGSPFSYIYFSSFVLINVFTVVQLLIAVVLEAFSDIDDVRGAACSQCARVAPCAASAS
ncbi:MAG: ion transporter, partial [Methanosarcinales archaeon]